MARVNAVIPDELRKRLYHLLLDQDISFSEWLRRQIEVYLKEHELKGKKRKGKEG